jgi:hypothetical protein
MLASLGQSTCPDSLLALEFECLAFACCAGDSRRPGPADRFVGGQLALPGEELDSWRSPKRFEEMAEKRWAALE